MNIFRCCFSTGHHKLLSESPKSIIPGGRILARVTDIYDGDTITVSVVHCGVVFEYNVRFYGIDTPELKYKGLNKTTEKSTDPKIIELKNKRAAGFAAKNYLVDMIKSCPNQFVYLECKGTEKYGRLLAEVFPVKQITLFGRIIADNESFSKKLIAAGHAVPYFGGRRDEDS